jgi:hypothetical protein
MKFKKLGVMFAGAPLFLALFCQAADCATISGIVADSGGYAINGAMNPIQVHAYTGNPCGSYQWAGAAWINTGGAFSITGLPAGTYYLRTDNTNQSNYINEWWVDIFGQSSANCSDAQPVTVAEEDNVTARNFMLDTGASVSGTVYDISGTNPITGTEVQVQAMTGDPCGWRQTVAWTQTNTSNGTFTFLGLPPGTYYLQSNNMSQSGYVNEWWASTGSTFNCSGAQTIQISSPGQAITGKDFQLDLGGSISGTVRDSEGTAITGTEIQVQAITGDPCGWYQTVAWTQTNTSNGTFTFLGLPPGTYYLQSNNMSQSDYVNEWWASTGSTFNCSGAQTIQISSPGQAITGKDFQLDLGGSTSGTVYKSDGTTPIEDAQIVVNAFTGSCGSGGIIGSGWTNTADGTYRIRGLPVATYFLATGNMNQSDYVNMWWAGTGSVFNCNAADPVVISSQGEEVDGKDFQLDLGGSISGTVYQSDGVTPVTGVNIDVSALQGNPCGSSQWMGGTWTNSSEGTYKIRGLPNGAYYLYTNNMGQSGYVNEWWASPASTYLCGGAQTVNLSTPGQAITGRNFQLDLGGSISGAVYSEDGPVEGVQIQVFAGPCGQTWLNGAMTDEDGHYTVTGLPPTDVYVKACATCVSHLNYIDKHYDGGDGVADNECGLATPVSVISGGDTADIVFYLDRGARRVLAHEAVISGGRLSTLFWVQPAFRDLVVSASVTMPNPDRGTGGTYTFDQVNDILPWTSECRFINGWIKDFGLADPADFGVYSFTVDFEDGVREVYTWNLQDVAVVPVTNISVTVNDNGTALVTWDRNTANSYYYQVRVRDISSGIEIFRSNSFMNISQLSLSANDLRCLEIGKTYRWLVRVYDSTTTGTYSTAETAEAQYPYGYLGPPVFLANRYTSASVQKWRGHLAMFFDTRPGSRGYVKSITVSGPEGVTGAGGPFSYGFNLATDWIDVSTETRWLRGWWKEDLTWTAVDGTYTFTIEYDDDLDGTADYTEVVTRNLNGDTISAVDGSTMEAIILPDGSIQFSWGLTGTPGLRYEVRIRSLDGTEEYYNSGWLTDGTTVTPTFNNTRAMVRGEMYQWYIRVYSSDGDTMEQSISKQFLYDPAPLQDGTAAVFGPYSATLTNPYFPLRLGDKLIYAGTGTFSGYGRYMEAVDTDVVDSVNCLKVLIRGEGNDPDPDADPAWFYVWFGQDNSGNVWVLQAFNGEEAYTEFSGLSEAVLWMPADMVAGRVYFQMGDEYAQVQKTGVNVSQLSTGLGPYSSCVKALVTDGLGDYDTEYLAPSMGIVREDWNDGGLNGWELAEVYRYGVYDEVAVDFGSIGLYHYAGGALKKLSASNPEHMLGVDKVLYVDFGSLGFWSYSEGAWSKWMPYGAEGMVSVGKEVWVDLGSRGLWQCLGEYMVRKSRSNPESMVAVGGDLFVDFGLGGLYRYDGVWTKLSDSDTEGIYAAGSDVYVDFGIGGFWRYKGNVWEKLSGSNAEGVAVSGAAAYVDFGSVGLWRYDGAWLKLTGSNPEGMVTMGSDLYADFGSIGIWKYSGGVWTKLSASNAENLYVVGSDLYADLGGGGFWKYAGGGWTKLSPSNAESVCPIGNVLYVDFGSVGFWKYDGAWLRLSTSNPQGMVPANLE